jgi:hypothetical protein
MTIPINTPAKTEGFAQNGWKYDKRVTAMMVEDMLFDPILGAKVLLGITKIPPHEELRILAMWSTYCTLDDSGFSTGKSFTYAIIAALRSLLIPGRIGGILSGTFRQGQLIFQNFDRWHSTSKIFRNCVKVVGGKPRLVHGSAVWEAFFRGGSTVRVLPPNFLQDSERLRSERWHDGYFDEWTTFGNFKAFTTTIIGRVTALNEDFHDCPVRQNHIHLASTPNFKHHPSYRIVKKLQANIDAGNKSYKRLTFNYRHVPNTKKYAAFVDRKTIFMMQTMNPKGVVTAEVDGYWTDDSLSYYSSSLVENDRLRHKTYILTARLRADDIYLAAFDMARGRAGSKRNKGGDDFAMSVLRIPRGKHKPEYCFAIRRNNIESAQAAAIVQEFHQRFQFSYVMYDPGGGGMFVRDELRKPEQYINGQNVSVYPMIEMDDSTGTMGDMILIPFRRSSFFIDRLWGKMRSDSILVNRVHQNMRDLLENFNIRFPNMWGGWQDLGCLGMRREIDQMRDTLNSNTSLPELQRAHAEIDLAIRQLVSVDVERDDNGDPVLDKFQMYKFKSKEKKDSAYSLIYAALLILVWNQMGDSDREEGNSTGGDTYFASGGIVG